LKNRADHSAAFSRRRFLAAGLAMSLQYSVSLAAAARDPLAILTQIYRDAVKGRGPSWIDDGERPKYLSKSLIALWAKSDKKTPPGDEGPIDFDLVCDTNGLSLAGFSLKVEKQDERTATIAATLAYSAGDANPGTTIVTYDLVREDGQWKIDEMRGSGATVWSLRDMLTRSLKD
jgi:hypothetical protein